MLQCDNLRDQSCKMKKLLLALFGLVSFSQAGAQNFTVADTFKYLYQSNGYVDIKNSVTNISSSPITIDWKIISHTLPANWVDSIGGVCDNKSCYDKSCLSNNVTYTSDPISAGGKCDMKITVSLANASASGTYHLKMQITEGSTIDTTTFEITKWATSVKRTLRASNDVSLYPNPAHNDLNVVFDASTGIKTAAIYNVIGKAISSYRVSANGAKLDVSDIPQGIYFLRLLDANGSLVATRKFTHQ
jgi:hypothetical protein